MPSLRHTRLQSSLDELYTTFDGPDSVLDPIQIVRRYPRLEDREIVAFVAAGLAFGRVASVMASVEAVCAVLGDAPGAFVRRFDPARQGRPLRGLVHRWTRGDDLVALLWILRRLIERHGTLERAVADGMSAGDADVGGGLEHLGRAARAVDLIPAYGRQVPRIDPGPGWPRLNPTAAPPWDRCERRGGRGGRRRRG